jgi:hypothetical protein
MGFDPRVFRRLCSCLKLNTGITCETHIYLKKIQVCGKQLPTVFHKHADACSGE